MKKMIALSETIIISIVSILINSLVFTSFYYSLKDAEYTNLSFSIFIVLLSFLSIVGFVILVTTRARQNILYLIFSFCFFLGLTTLILMVFWRIDSNSSNWILSILNLSFTTYSGKLFYRELKNELK